MNRFRYANPESFEEERVVLEMIEDRGTYGLFLDVYSPLHIKPIYTLPKTEVVAIKE